MTKHNICIKNSFSKDGLMGHMGGICDHLIIILAGK